MKKLTSLFVVCLLIYSSKSFSQCPYNGTTYAIGSTSCQGGERYICAQSGWVDDNATCSSGQQGANLIMSGDGIMEVVSDAKFKKAPSDKTQECTGNACGVISFKANPNQNVGGWQFHNSSTKTVRLGLRWYFGNCSNTAYYDLAPNSSSNFGIARQTFCLPFEASYK